MIQFCRFAVRSALMVLLVMAVWTERSRASVTPVVVGGAQERGAEEPLRVGVRIAAPFVVDVDGYQGLAMDAWRIVATELDLEWEAETLPLGPLLDRTEAGDLDVAVGALTVTAAREERVDFTHPLLSSGLGIAVHAGRGGLIAAVFRSLLSSEFLRAIGALSLLLMVVGLLLWLAERRRNTEQFARGPRGLLDGFWFSAVTMTTVGYGDKAPVSGVGRAITLVWMFASIIVISGFTGAIASSVTVDSLNSRIRGVSDLVRVRVAVIENSAGESWTRGRGLLAVAVDDVEEALDLLEEGAVDAVVHDRPILQYFVRELQSEHLKVLPELVVRQDLAFALPEGSDLREEINRTLIDLLSRPEWAERCRFWLGSD